MVIQQYEKAKVIQDEQLERLTQICQEQGVSNCSHIRFCLLLFGSAQGSGCWWCLNPQGPQGQRPPAAPRGPEQGKRVSEVARAQPG